jgi:hypothetical protein
MFPCWIIPLIGGIYVLWSAFAIIPLALFLAFCIVGFAVIPLISRLIACKDCEIKDKCPWMMKSGGKA